MAAARTAEAYTWLLADVLIFLVLTVCILTYKDFDEPMRYVTRVLLMVLIAQLWVSSVHILTFMRRSANGETMLHWAASYGFFFVKLGIIVLAVWWLNKKEFL
jgi:hypothetical protein